MTIQPIIKPHHLSRTAYVYLRQSSPGQVRRNHEGKQRQRAMVDHVAKLGWPTTQIVLLDGDTGQSGSSLHGRADYRTLAEAIVTDKAGIVAARELSRLVRDNQDWAQLVRLCRFQDVLLADEHRLYDPANPQDRMVLGVQGAFNEFELSMILDRMQESLKQKAQRGEQYDALPPGYICRHVKLCEKHPDQSVQRAIKKVLDDFERFPSANQLYLYLQADEFQLPVVPHGRDWRDVEWVHPSYNQILNLVRHPAYAGIYVRGRTKAFVTLDEEGHKQTKSRRVPREEWDVFLEDHHEAYIPKKTWERNMEKIAANTNVRGDLTKGPVGHGESLMAGLLRCGRCGHRLQVRYPSPGVRYFCASGQRQRKSGGAKCLNFYGADLEVLLAEEILEVVGPAGVEAAQRAAERLTTEFQQQRQLVVDRVKAMRDAEARAAREYKQTDVTYTEVRQTLGAEWEAALARVGQEELRLATFDQRQIALPTPAQRKQLEQLGEDVRRLWSHPRVTGSLKQQLARVLIKEIVANVDDERDEVVLMIQWSGGHHTELRGPRTPRKNRLSSSDLKSVVETLRKIHPDGAIASALNRGRIRTTQGKTWTRDSVERYRRRVGILVYDSNLKRTSGWLTQSETATRLEISPMSVHRLVRSGILPAEQPHRGLPMVITTTVLSLPDVKRAVKSLKAGHIRPLPEDPNQLKLF
jgi:DNA invertase Pin-like site-specific DNA recombinase